MKQNKNRREPIKTAGHLTAKKFFSSGICEKNTGNIQDFTSLVSYHDLIMSIQTHEAHPMAVITYPTNGEESLCRLIFPPTNP
ncbi:hypothetical protein [Microbulbifer sp. A4B17]|uniref:hypothetical protein n=1 Tax=Microbulbifer sp. A4B17 TaxID=359370 RepID=UPI0013005C7A|nr:hypothetical protein [Microbulbifer sp. A4B17]